MRGLVFVDLDNVPNMSTVIYEGLAFARQKRAPFGGTAVVCIAANTFRFYEDKLRAGQLREEARRLAEALGATCERVEIAVTLTMPQSADFALKRLASEAPSAEGAGAYDYAVVLTKDRGLQQTFQRLYSGLRWVEVKLWDRGKAWTSIGRGQAARRTGPSLGSGVAATQPTTSGQFTIVVEDDATAAWACGQRVDVGPEQDLYQLSLRLDREPWLLTQIGPSTSSLRGIARLDALPLQDSITLGAVSKSDGLELRGGESLPRRASMPRAATVGIGAVRFLSVNATVPCRLPLAMLQDGIDYEINRNGVDIDSALGHFGYADPIGSVVDVTLRQDKDSVVACVEPGRTSVDAWWVRHTEAKSEKRVALPGAISAPVRAKAFLMRSPPEFTSERVCLGVGAKVGDQAVAQANIARGQIGQGLWNGLAIAIYATRTNIASGDHLPIRPIQGASLPSELRELRLLPLVVPL